MRRTLLIGLALVLPAAAAGIGIRAAVHNGAKPAQTASAAHMQDHQTTGAAKHPATRAGKASAGHAAAKQHPAAPASHAATGHGAATSTATATAGAGASGADMQMAGGTDRRMSSAANVKRMVTPQKRRAAAAAAAALRARTPTQTAPAGAGSGPLTPPAGTSAKIAPRALDPTAPPDYFGTTPNYANSPLPQVVGGNVVAGTGIRKFFNTLPGIGSANQNDLNHYIPQAVPDTTTYAGSDYYEIELRQFTQKLHTDLPATTFRGYVQVNKGTDGQGNNTIDPATIQYLGPLIVANRDRPVRVKFTNKLLTGTDGNLFLPVDTTLMGDGTGPNGGTELYTQNRATMHLHGGNTPWISDGTQHQWITPAGENTSYPKGVSVQNVPDMQTPGPGSQTFYYTNQQSARLMFTHDHTYGMTRLNVYAGEAMPYELQDPVERQLVTDGVLPSTEMPLIIQDKTFVPNDTQLAAQDPTWNKTLWGGEGNLWWPHVYMPNQNPYNDQGANPMGRWDYGPWFWPPFAGLVNGPVDNPYYDPVGAPWEPPVVPGVPSPTTTPEAFQDTPLVNGTPYPSYTVQRKAYRFRILNASNDRYLNLQLYYAKSNATMWNPDGTLNNANAGEVPMVNAVKTTGYPATWPTDGREGGVPDPAASGPTMIQIGTEGGILPAPAVLTNQPVGYDYNRRSITVLNVTDKTLFMGPAERADVIVDFSQVPAGSKLILYNDSPAPVPAGDTRLDYYTGDPDQTSTGGAPTTLPGYGPNTRTIMQFKVGTDPAAQAFSLSTLQARLPVAYAASQARPLVPEPVYDAAFGTTSTTHYGRIQDNSLSLNGPLGAVTLTAGGTGYASAPTVGFTGGGGSGATAVATLAPRTVASLNLTGAGSAYTSAPTVTFTGGGGTGATATATLSTRTLSSLSVTSNGSNYSFAPTVSFSGGGGSGATALANVSNKRVVSITLTNRGSGYTSTPTVTLSGGGGSGARATANLAAATIDAITLTNPGTAYTSEPTVGFSGGGGSGATATATLSPATVGSVTLTNVGLDYGSAPTVTFTGGGGSGAAATATVNRIAVAFNAKAIIEDFDPEYGRMDSMLGTEMPNTTNTQQTSIFYADTDPPTEVVKSSISATAIGALGDGTQIWKITHNGVDTHAVHWHMFDVQLLNRVGWDGAIRPADPNEIGWKDTVRMNPLEDVVVALRPIVPTLPFDVPNSIRPLDPTKPIGATTPLGMMTPFRGIDPMNQPAPVSNQLVNFGWEHIWHCHMLGHEDNMMMRPISVAVPPRVPTGVSASVVGNGVQVRWTDNSANETSFMIERASSPVGPWSVVATIAPHTGTGAMSFTNAAVAKQNTYYYRVTARNRVGYTQTYAAPAVGYPNTTVDSFPSTPSSAVNT